MLDYDPIRDLKHFPTPMAKFGANPFGEPLYRIVLASSVRHLVGGMWPDMSVGYRYVPKYRAVTAAWILERWMLPVESQRDWEKWVEPISGMSILGPYPSRGYYERVWDFDGAPDAESLDTIIGAIERKRSHSFQDHRDRLAKEYDQEERATRSAAEAEIRDAVTAFGVAPISSLSGVARGTKTVPELRSAEELGLRVPRRGRNPRDIRGLNMSSTMLAGRV